MSELRLTLRLYVVAVLVAAVLAVLLAATTVTRQATPNGLVLFGILFAFAVVCQLKPLKLSVKMHIGVADTATFAAVLLFDPFEAMLLAGGATLMAKLLGAIVLGRTAPWYQHLFNGAAATLGVGAGALAYRSLLIDDGSILANPLAVIAGAIACYLGTTAIVDLAVAIQLRRSPMAAWWRVHRRDLAQHASLYLMGALLAVTAATHPWAVALFVMPAALVFLSLREILRLREQTRAAIYELADLVDRRDPYTHGHSQRVADYAARLAQALRMSAGEIELVREAARMHDLGKIATTDRVLQKAGPLLGDELTEMRAHAEYGATLLARLPEFWEGAALVGAHHERCDGSGYPRGLQGSEIPLEAMVIAVADAYDAMATDRPYRRALAWPAIRSELVRGRGTQWDAGVVDAFLALWEPRETSFAEVTPAVAR